MAEEVDYRNLNPEQLRGYVGCFVELVLCENQKVQGWVHTIDPVTHNIVVGKPNTSKTIVIVMSKSVKQFRVLAPNESEPKWLNDFATKQKHEFTTEQLEKRKQKLIEWLDKNRVPIMKGAENGQEIEVAGGLSIEAPYGEEDCQGTNEIVLEKIRKLVSSMPNET